METTNNLVLREYYILKLIFSHLPSKDLRNASKVCKDWHIVASRVCRENGEPQSCFLLYDNTIMPPLNNKPLPKVILNFTANSLKENVSLEKVQQCLNDSFDIRNIPCYHLHVDSFIYSWKFSQGSSSRGAIGVASECGYPDYSLVLLSDMPGVNIECYQEYQKCMVNAQNGKPADLEHILRSKGVLYMIGSNTSNVQAKILIHDLIELVNSYGTNSQQQLMLVGGISQRIKRFTNKFQKTNILVITFNGDNVSVDGALFEPSRATFEDFSKSLSERVGPIPDDCIRLAFGYICINCIYHYDSDIFTKYFPGVLLNGFCSLGEYFLNFRDRHELKKKTKKCYLYDNTAPFLIVTLKKSKNTN